MKKVLKSLIVCMFVCIFSIALVGCSAYNKLSLDEKIIFDMMSVSLTDFKNPGSVILANVNTYNDMEQARIKITAQNSYGGSTTTEYVFMLKTYTGKSKVFPKGAIYEYDDLFKFDSAEARIDGQYFLKSENDGKEYSVSKINAALKEYKTKQGFI